MRRILAFALLLVVAACSDSPVTPAVDYGVEMTPAFSFSNNPDNGNPRFHRMNDVQYGFILIDPRSDLFALMQASDISCTTPPTLYGVMDEQLIAHDPVDPLAGRITDLVLGRDIYVAVFDGYSQWDGSCADLNARMLAEGSGNLTYVDNDFRAFLRPHNNVNAFGFMAQSQLELVGGGQASYNGVSRCVWDGEDPTTVRCVDRINFH